MTMLETISNAMIVGGALVMARPPKLVVVTGPQSYGHVLREAHNGAIVEPMPEDIKVLQTQIGAKLHLVQRG